ncbi:MAG: amino acid adenylation domain-containing protein [Pseudomonadota bacterium]
MSVAALLGQLSAAGIEVELDAENLRIRGPRGALTPELRERINASRASIMAVLASARQPAAVPDLQPIPRFPPEQPAPLSQAQYRLWFLDQIHAGSAFLNLPFTVRMRGLLDVDALSWVVAEVGRRHDALRTAIEVVDGEPRQVVRAVDIALEIVDFSSLPAERRGEAMLARRATEMATPFDLGRAPLIRFLLLRDSADHHLFMFVSNHVVFDGWSHDLLFRDLKALYEARVSRGVVPPPPGSSFRDFVRWQREWLARPAHAAEIDRWTERLRGMPTVLDLPSDLPRPPVPSQRGIRHLFRLEPQLTARLRRVAAAHGATLNMLSLAAVELLLARFSGQSDFGIGIPTMGRIHPEVEDVIGMFVNTLVFRSDVAAGGRFVDLLTRVRDTTAAALGHQDVPLEKLVQALHPERDGSRTPLYQAMFSYQEASARDYRLADLTLEQVPSFSGSTATDIAFWLRDHGSWALAVVETASDLFQEESVARFARSWQAILEAVAGNPELALADVPVMAGVDERRLLVELNDTVAPWDDTALVHRLFEEAVDRHPEAPALYFEAQALSFAELDRRANRLAHVLVERGVEPGALVGVCLRRTPDLVVSLLAVLKAGGAYVPLDPGYPADRLAHVLADSATRLLVTTSDLARRIGARCPTLSLDGDAPPVAPAGGADGRLAHAEDAGQLAYVMYTSGSTGQPKGVMLEHRNVCSFFAGMQRAIGLDDTGVWLSGTSTSFDISVLELFGSLCHGRAVALLGETILGQVDDARYTIPALVKRHGVTHFQCTPSQSRILLLDEAGRGALRALRQLIVGGEALPQGLADELAALVTGDVVNAYGPTETTVWSTTARVRAGEPVTIGRPIANTVVFVVDGAGRPVPFGSIGELWIGGPGVARGYWGRADLTAERFVDNNLRPDIGGRLYRTGDLVSFGPDGMLRYLGRNDHQVKIRGHRIELGELESALRKVAGVRDAVVVARGDGADRRLVAYLATDGDYAGDDALRTSLRGDLPEFMLPSAIAQLDTLPLTPNGKVDRARLPALSAEMPTGRAVVAPVDEVESKLCTIWRDVIVTANGGTAAIGTTDNFFDLGGHSLLALQILNQVHRVFDVRLPLATLFECPTVQRFAERLRDIRADSTGAAVRWTTVVPIQPQGSLPPFFCVAGIRGNPMELRHLAMALGRQQPFYGLQYRGVDGTRAPHRRIRDLAEEFLNDVRKVQPHGPYYLGGYSAGGLAAYELACGLRDLGEPVGLVVLIDTYNPTLPDWTLSERVSAHLKHLREQGVAYIGGRIGARFMKEAENAKKGLRAWLASQQWFEYRHDAVELATLEAERSYVPGRFQGDALVIRVEFDRPPSHRLGRRKHESNGWRGLIDGALLIEEVVGTHLNIVGEAAAPVMANVLARALSAARKRAEGARATEAASDSESQASRRKYMPP